MEFFAFGMNSTFLVGRLFVTLLTFFMLQKFAFGPMMNYLRNDVPSEETLQEARLPQTSAA